MSTTYPEVDRNSYEVPEEHSYYYHRNGAHATKKIPDPPPEHTDHRPFYMTVAFSLSQGLGSELPAGRGESQTVLRRIGENKRRTQMATDQVSRAPRPGWNIEICAVQNRPRRTVRGGGDRRRGGQYLLRKLQRGEGRHAGVRELQGRGGRLHRRSSVRVELARGRCDVGAR